MSEEKTVTAGQLAYEAWQQTFDPNFGVEYPMPPYNDGPGADHDAWEAAAQSVTAPLAAENERVRALLARAVRELADSGSPGQNRLADELARDGGIEL